MAKKVEKVKIKILQTMKIKNKNGYAYLLLLVFIAFISITGLVLGATLYSRAVRIEKENELIFRGLAYKNAIRSYYNSSKTGNKSYPARLQDLLNDPRFLSKRHIRKLYCDPITGGDWDLILTSDGYISGVVSKSKKKPIKQKNFPPELKNFEGAEHYSEWTFMFSK